MTDLAADRWVALRALNEGAMPSHELLALATGRSASSIARRAEQEGWIDRDTVLAARLRRIHLMIDGLVREVEAIGAVGGYLDRPQGEAADAMMRTLEKIGEMTRAGPCAKERIRRDLADVFRRIDERIVELAGEKEPERLTADPQ